MGSPVEDTINRVITWADIWRTPQSRLSFLVRAAYDTLPCPRNLAQWFGSEGKCFLCSKDNAGLQHMLSGCNIALTQGRFRWRHNQVLRKLAEQLERCRVRANNSSDPRQQNIAFIKPGEVRQKTRGGEVSTSAYPGEELGHARRPGQAAGLSNRDHTDNPKAGRCDVVHSCQESPNHRTDCALGGGNTSST